MISRYLVGLSDGEEGDRLGAKGEGLRILHRLKFNVPETYCLTVDAYERFVEESALWPRIADILADSSLSSGIKAQKIGNVMAGAPFPGDLAEKIEEHRVIGRGSGSWAVRSSSNFEDLTDASFAGIYDTFLNVERCDRIIETVRKCWVSLWNERAIVYRERRGIAHGRARMAVIIQRMVPARWSGVIFTVHPSAGALNTMVIEYCEGLGDALVSGRVRPETALVERDTGAVSHNGKQDSSLLPIGELALLSNIAMKAERAMGYPLDMEWAHDGESFVILQSRPMGLPAARDSVGPEKMWTRANIGEVLPHTVTPLTWAVFVSILKGADLSAAGDHGLKEEENGGLRCIMGRGYIRLDLFLDSFCYLPFVTPEIMKHVLGVPLPAVMGPYNRPRSLATRAAQCLFWLTVFRRFDYLSFLQRRLPDLGLSAAQGLDGLFSWAKASFIVHLRSTAYAAAALASLTYFSRRWFSERSEEVLSLLAATGVDMQSVRQGTMLRELAEHVGRYEDLERLVLSGSDWQNVECRLSDVEGGRTFSSLFAEFLATNGARAAGELELCVPRWKEDPSSVFLLLQRLVDGAASNHAPPERASSAERRRMVEKTISQQVSGIRRAIFLRLADSYRDFSALRENMKYRLMEGYAEIRAQYLVQGQALVELSLLAEQDDIFFLLPDEIGRLSKNGASDQRINEVVKERKERFAMLKAQPAPEIVYSETIRSDDDGSISLTGIGCSPGMVEGSARVIKDFSDAGMLRAGEILVAPHTDPGWTPLFLICRGLVTDTGGFLSHGATVAREYGIPAVVSVSGATDLIATGDVINVNGTEGSVTILKSGVEKLDKKRRETM